MKKQLLNLSFVAVALALYITANAAPVTPVNTMNVPAAESIVIDGLADDNYSDVIETEPMNPEGQGDAWSGETDFTASFQVCADAHFFYVLTNIQDDVDHSWTGEGDPWTFDNYELFFQLDTNTASALSSDSTAAQLRINRGVDTVTNTVRATADEFKLYMEAAAPGGWITEVACPWTCTLPASYEPEDIMDYVGQPIGFDFAGADSDGTDAAAGARDYQTAWDLDGQDGTEDLAWNDASVLGYITMSSLPEIAAGVDATAASTLNVHPNPATGLINLDVDGLNSFEIFSISGAKVMAGETNGTIDVSSLNSGIYMLKAGNVTQKFAVK